MNNSLKKYIETSSGKAFYPYNPVIEQIDINDIAHAISQLCRFGGTRSNSILWPNILS